MYTCGPTVYDSAHVGNFRAFLTYDVLKRVLLYLGLRVTHICNITDVDDKIIVRANELKLRDMTELTRPFEQRFLLDLQQLHCIPATHYPRATDYIPEMLSFIQELQQRQLAYETSDGSWYFDTQQQAGRYGQQLVQLSFDDMLQQKETENSDGKRHFADFCLWKAFKPGFDRDDAAWSSDMYTSAAATEASSSATAAAAVTLPSNIAKGRPGWHLECSAMARAFFPNQTLDLHGGGMDLKFPHHENEIAQSEGLMDSSGHGGESARFCNCWFHNGFVEVGPGNEKMSKSQGNFRTLQQVCPTALDIRAYRYLVVSSQYRNPLRLSEEVLLASKKAVQRIDTVKSQVEMAIAQAAEHQDSDGGNSSSSNHHPESDLARRTVPAALQQFDVAITDDLSMPRAAAALFSLIKAAELELKKQPKQQDEKTTLASALDIVGLKAVLRAMEQMDRVFGIFYQVPGMDEDSTNGVASSDALVPEDVLELVRQRNAAKEAKDWELADSLRQRIAALGFVVQDVKGGVPIVTPVN